MNLRLGNLHRTVLSTLTALTLLPLASQASLSPATAGAARSGMAATRFAGDTATAAAVSGRRIARPLRGVVSSSVEIKDENGDVARYVYSDIVKAGADAPVVVLLNGLIYDIHRWDDVTAGLAKNGVTVIRMTFSAQPESLRLWPADGNGNRETPPFLTKGLELSDLADEVFAVLDHHGITKPVTLVGLSYGAAVATEVALRDKTEKLGRIDNLTLLSPLVVPLDSYDPSGHVLRNWLSGVRFWENASCLTYGWINPWLCSAKDFWYDSFYNTIYQSYLSFRVQDVPEDIDAATYKKAVFHLVRATRDFDLKAVAPKLRKVHMVVAENDEARLKDDQLAAWNLIPKRQRLSFTEVPNAEHALPDVAPKATVDELSAIATGAQ